MVHLPDEIDMTPPKSERPPAVVPDTDITTPPVCTAHRSVDLIRLLRILCLTFLLVVMNVSVLRAQLTAGERLKTLSQVRQSHLRKHHAAIKRENKAAMIREAASVASVEKAIVTLCLEKFPQDPGTADWVRAESKTRRFLVNEYFAEKQFPESIHHHQRWISLLELELGNDHWWVVSQRKSLENNEFIATLSPEQRDVAVECVTGLSGVFATATVPEELKAQLTERSELLERVRGVFGEECLLAATAHQHIGLAQLALGHFSDASRTFTTSLHIRRSELGANHPATAESTSGLGSANLHLGQYSSAEALLREALKVRRDVFGESAEGTVHTQLDLATALRHMGRMDDARRQIQDAVDVCQRDLGDAASLTIECLAELGDFLLATGDSEKALEVLNGVYERVIDSPTVSVRRKVIAANDVGLACSYLGNQAAAIVFFVQASQLLEEQAEAGGELAATVQHNISAAYAQLGNHEDAVSSIRSCIRLRTDHLGPHHPDTAAAHVALGILQRNAGHLESAEREFSTALAVLSETKNESSTSVLNAKGAMASLLIRQGRYHDARKLLEEIEQVAGDSLWPNHHIRLDTMALLASVCERLDDIDAALKYSTQAIEAAAESGDLSTSAKILSNSGYLMARRQEFEQAAPLFRQAQRCLRLYSLMNLAGISQRRNQLALLRQFQDYRALASSVALCTSSQESWHALLECTINGKGLVQEAVAAGTHRQLEKSASFEELTGLRREYTQLAMTSNSRPGIADREGRLQQLNERIHQLTIAGAVDSRNVQRGLRWIMFEEVRNALGVDSVLVEFERFAFLDWTSDDYSQRMEHYLAWIIPPAGSGAVAMVNLGPADAIDESIRKWRGAIAEGSGGLTRGDRRRTKQVADQESPAREINRLLLRPLKPHLKSYDHWILSPDGLLWLAPFAALQLNEQRFVVEDHVISLVVSGRHLVTPQREHPLPNQSLVIADPDFDLERSDSQSGEQLAAVHRGVSLRHQEAFPRNWDRLPGTADEVKDLRPILEEYLDESVNVLTEDSATETAVKSVRRPRLLTFSTHGYFLPDQQSQTDSDLPGMASPLDLQFSDQLVNPLLRCGLLLAGANQSGTTSSEDGILTGLEISGLDLRGTSLVVLSACETGLGEVWNGDGVAGLRQAFQLAGAENVLATLWSIPDRDTSVLMRQFWNNVVAGQTPASALRQAQLAILSEARAAGTPAPPFRWAAFTLTGLSANDRKDD